MNRRGASRPAGPQEIDFLKLGAHLADPLPQ